MKRLWMFTGLALAFAASGEGLPDPTRPPAAATTHATAQREAAPVLSAVMTFKGGRSAIFNGHLVHEGSTLGAYTIEAVLEDGVRYRHAGQTQELHLAHTSNVLKKPAADVARVPSGVH